MIPIPPHPAQSRFRRVVVAFDGASDEDLDAVEAAAAFAARLRAELFGLFIEDIDLARLAEHPGITTLGALSAGRAAMFQMTGVGLDEIVAIAGVRAASSLSDLARRLGVR